MKKKISIIFMTILIILLTCGTVCTTQVQAALQSNPNTHYKKYDTVTNWMTNLRNMETTGGALGLTETINGTTKLATSESNNLDSHMMKSTEYGAIAILSASGYGNPKTLQNSTIKSTTGNTTGVYFNTASTQYVEFVAGILGTNVFPELDGRYYDLYTSSNSSAKSGDALGTSSTTNKGCAGWHSATKKEWFSKTTVFLGRNYSTGIFSFTGYLANVTLKSRGVVVCGEGL